MAEYIEIVRGLRYEDTPDYSRLETILLGLDTGVKSRSKKSIGKTATSSSKSQPVNKASSKSSTSEVKSKVASKKKKTVDTKTLPVDEDSDQEEENVVKPVSTRGTRKATTLQTTRVSPRSKTVKSQKKASPTPDIIAISSDEDEEEEEARGDTPIKAKKPKVATSPSPSHILAGKSVTGSKRSRPGDNNIIHSLLEDSDEDSEAESRGNTPVKVKKTKQAVNAPEPSHQNLPQPALRKRITCKDSSTNVVMSKKLAPRNRQPLPAVKISPLAQGKENLDNDDTGGCSLSDPQLCLLVLDSVIPEYIGKVFLLDSRANKHQSKRHSKDPCSLSMHVVGSAEEVEGDEAPCDIVLHNDEFISAR